MTTKRTDEDHFHSAEENTPIVSPGNYSPVSVYMEDSLGAIFLGALAGVLLIGWMQAEARYRELITQWELTYGSSEPEAR